MTGGPPLQQSSRRRRMWLFKCHLTTAPHDPMDRCPACHACRTAVWRGGWSYLPGLDSPSHSSRGSRCSRKSARWLPYTVCVWCSIVVQMGAIVVLVTCLFLSLHHALQTGTRGLHTANALCTRPALSWLATVGHRCWHLLCAHCAALGVAQLVAASFATWAQDRCCCAYCLCVPRARPEQVQPLHVMSNRVDLERSGGSIAK